MPASSILTDLYDGQITLKFYNKKHQYFRKINEHPVKYIDIPNEDEVIANLELTDTEWIKVKSTTGITGSCLDKPFLYNWLVDTTASEFKRCIKKGMTLEDAEGKAKGARWKALRKGGNIGTAVHDWINEFILNELDDSNEAPSIKSIGTKEVTNCIFGFLKWYEEYVKEPIQTEYLLYHPGLDIAGTLDFIFINKDGELEVVDFKTGYTINPADVMQLAFYRKTYALQEGSFPEVASIIHLMKDEEKAIPYRTLNHDANIIAFEAGHYLVNWRDTLTI